MPSLPVTGPTRPWCPEPRNNRTHLLHAVRGTRRGDPSRAALLGKLGDRDWVSASPLLDDPVSGPAVKGAFGVATRFAALTLDRQSVNQRFGGSSGRPRRVVALDAACSDTSGLEKPVTPPETSGVRRTPASPHPYVACDQAIYSTCYSR